ncbi:MAG: hypothetical protein A2660_00055 [Candidatus Doudnabacteria bacterium RIFCSPHIGHO2_01_FULL_45_18]|uniref:Uncharacterized protein n=1 Tax=Candidatus Doudnabacteria bacterium RIFCSPHIGHO2_01_FULL_45_18 TaxID=1817823 RepID=A0A1F5NRF8_9BACT|nr:MAG: hypothetical protein A2660_00055 [Candidatus Doudnabacteria bacterium RIFCSPHIGHO2_01_FULL_45_18]
MIDEKWEALKEELHRKFKVEDEHFEDLVMQTGDGPVVQGQAEIIIFSAKGGSASGGELPFSKIKLVRESKPVVLDKKMIYSHQQGKSARTEYKFSETEKSYKIKAYKWDDYNDDWKEIDAAGFGH